MKVMADTNIIISALLFPASLPARVLLHIADNHDLVLCDHIVAELRNRVARKRLLTTIASNKPDDCQRK